MLIYPSADREDIRIKNNVLRRKPDFIHEDAICPLADADFLSVSRGLPLLIECHHHHRSAVFQNVPRLPLELIYSRLQRDRVHDAFTLQAFQSGLDDFPLRRVHHERHLRHVRLAAEELQEARHRRDSINHPLVHADVYDVGPVLHLLPRHGHSLLVFVLLDQLRKFRRPRDVRALADHQKTSELLRERIRPRKAQRQRCSRGKLHLLVHLARPADLHRFCNRRDVLRRVAAAAAGDVQ